MEAQNSRYKEVSRNENRELLETLITEEKRDETKHEIRKNIYQSNYITQSYLPFTKQESNLMAIILSTLEKDERNYVWNIKNLLKVMKIEGKHYTSLIDSINGLFDKAITIKHERETEKIRLLSRIKYVDDDNIRWNDNVELTISNEIAPHLFNLKKLFTVYETASYLRLGALVSKKLYTVFAQYKTIGKITMEPNEIQRLLGTNYKSFAVLLSKNIKPAIEEIEDLTNVNNIKIIPVKNGRKIVAYKFEFDWQKKQMEIPLLPPSLNSDELRLYERLITDFWLTNFQAKKVVETLVIKDVNRTLFQITNDKTTIRNVGAYTVNILKKKFGLTFD
jgi:hypothetical protein